MFNKILSPMLLKERDKPFIDDNYIFELKYDGIRTLLYVSPKTFKLITRNGNDLANIYPELKSVQNIVGKHKVIFDGEIVAFKNGKPSFSELQHRNHLKNISKIKLMINEIPVCFVVFDIIYFDKDLTNLTLMKRKKILNDFTDTDIFIKTKMYNDGLKLFKHIKKIGLEGIVAKQKDSKYILGKRVENWVKIKNFKKEYFYVYGFTQLKDKYALYLGEYKNKKLIPVGKVSVMPDNDVLKIVQKQKKVKNIFIDITENINFVEPINKILVHYMERTLNNTLRQPFIKRS
jgi:ATP-dependent DNA ligase